MDGGAPLLHRPDGRALFQRVQGPVSAADFLHDVHGLAAALPDGRYLINLCRDRYGFAVAFAAGLLRGRTALLNVDPAALSTMATAYPGCTVATDAPLPDCPLPSTVVPAPAGHDGVDRAVPWIAADHVAAVVFTSGSTGAPLPHPKRWGALVARSRAAARQFGLASGSVVGAVPPQHMYGFELTVLLPLHAPVTSWCGPSFFPGDVAAALRAVDGPAVLVSTPLHLKALLQADTPPLALCISATAPLDAGLARSLEVTWNAPVMEIFGATECGSIASRRTTAGPDWTVYPGLDLAIDDAGAAVAGPFMDRVALADLLEPTQAGFRLLGRRTDVVKLAGRRASLPGLTEALLRVAGVDDGAFVAPDDQDRRGAARLVAVVVAPGRSAADILSDLRRVLDPAFLPRRVIHVDALPRNALGKLPRQALLRLVAGAV